jgi:RecA-family ATPase
MNTHSYDEYAAMASNDPQVIVNTPSLPVVTPPSQFTILGAATFSRKKIRPRDFLLSPWLPRQGLAMVYAPRGVGKTFFALEVACAVATGQPFLGWTPPNAANVLYLDGEMPAADLQQRLKAIELNRGSIGDDRLMIMTPDMQAAGMPDISRFDHQQTLAAIVNHQTDLVVIDNISTLCRSGNENEADSWSSVQTFILNLRASGISVLLIHHAGKGGNQRGTSKREDVLDTVIALKRPEDYKASEGARFEVHFEKARGFTGDDAEPFEVSLIIEENGAYHWEHDTLEETKYQKAARFLKSGLSQKDISIELNINKSTVSRYAKQAKQEGLF